MSAIIPSSASTQVATSPSKSNLYFLQTHLKGHTGLVLYMSITDDGKLASGGKDGVRVWDIRSATGKRPSNQAGNIAQLSRPSGPGARGATMALTWIVREDEPDDGIIYGTAQGFVVCWRELSGCETTYEESYCAQLANPGEITALTYELTSNRLAVANHNSVVQLFRVGPKLDLHATFLVIIKDHVPKALTFGQSGPDDKDVYSFGLYDSTIYTLSGKDGKVLHSRQTGSQIGSVAANLRRGVFCIDDPSQGAALYRYNSWDRVRTYPVSIQKSMQPRQVCFLEDCKFILSGSDHGVVYLFDRRSGKMVDELKTGRDRIQALTATENEEIPLIFSTMYRSGSDEACPIAVWRKNMAIPTMDKNVSKIATRPQNSWRTLLKKIIEACFVIMALGFLWQNRRNILGFD